MHDDPPLPLPPTKMALSESPETRGQRPGPAEPLGGGLALADMEGAPWAPPGGAIVRLGRQPPGGVRGSPQVGHGGAWAQTESTPHPTVLAPPHLTCNSPPDLVGGRHACGGVRAATAAPWPVSAALLTGRAWPAAGGLQTWGVGWPRAGLGGRGYLPNTEEPSIQKGHGGGQGARGPARLSGQEPGS